MTQRKIQTAGFRPTPEEEELLLAAEKATGRKRSELLRRCLKTSIAAVVREMLATHEEAVARFEQLATSGDSAHEHKRQHPHKPIRPKVVG